MSGSTPRVLLACDFQLRYTSRLAAGLARAGCRVALLTRDHGLDFGGDRAAMRAEVEGQLGGVADEICFLPGRVRELSTLPAVRAAQRRISRFAPQVVHLQDRTNNDPRLLVAAGVRPGRFAMTVHDPVPHPGDDPRSAPAAAFDRQMTRRARLIFVHADRLRDELLAAHTLDGTVAVVPHGADAPVVEPLPARPTMLFFGRQSYYKGLDVLLDALGAIWERVPDARLIVAGEGEVPDHPALADPRVDVRLGHIPEADVAGLFVGATCVVLPYRQASQSGVGSQAKSYGRPSVVTRLGGLPELVADGSGVVVEPEDPAALAGAAADLLADPGRAAAMGRLGAEALAASVGWPRVGDLTLRAYRDAGLLA